ncbi:MAG: hypothetical protein ACP5RF_02350 [Candidatus Micrarchaeia archaeon]
MVGYEKDSGLYFCEICRLHYTDKALAEKCQEWCSKHNSCNLAIASQSVEAVRGRANRQ